MAEIGRPLREEPLQVPDPLTEPARIEPPVPDLPATPVPEVEPDKEPVPV